MRSRLIALSTVLLASLAYLASPLAPTARVVAQEDRGADASPARLFEQSCASCHFTPDPKVATDQAWIRQLQETA